MNKESLISYIECLEIFNRDSIFLYLQDVLESMSLLRNASAGTTTNGTILVYLFGIITERLVNLSFSQSIIQVIT